MTDHDDHRPTRWTEATVYPDMWLNPDDDPRDNDGPAPEGELATLLDFITNYRLTLRLKCDGLTPAQLATHSVPPSTMSLLGLVRHLAEVERDWLNWITHGDPLPKLYGKRDADFDEAVGDPDLVASSFADLERQQAATDAELAKYAADLGQHVGREDIAVRELMVHMVDEYARHCGHADLLRECVDGRVGQ
ncbi:DinB family protein [Streptomyces sp. NPDC087440]|uniref:DinB family protein n=1 Tax=Streptomyces sp. NPDC087440 TaxID=3365790 RepID=UPI0037F88BF5